MGKAGNHSAMDGVRGKVGRKAVFRESFGETIVSVRPQKKRRKPTPSQQANREKFTDAAHYAVRQMAKPKVKEFYATGIDRKKRSSYIVATTDYVKPPKVHSIDSSAYSGAVGNEIWIHASDDFRVMNVNVIIVNASGNEIERGAAELSTKFRDGWIYVVTGINQLLEGTKIIAFAYDLPGNEATKTLTL